MAGVMDNSANRQPDFGRVSQYHQGIAEEMQYIQNIPQFNAGTAILDRLEVMSTDFNGKFDVLNGKFDALNGKFDVLNGKVDTLDTKVNAIETNLNRLDGTVNGLRGLC
jgi:hypothetical protein